MPEQQLQIPGADGPADSFVFTPSEGSGPWPGVVFLTDVWGVREANRTQAKKLSDEGYVVLLPNIFYRTDQLPIVDFQEFDSKNESQVKRLYQLVASLNSDQMRRDGKSYVDYLLSRDDVKTGKIGLVGHCFTGPTVIYIAAHIPDQIGAAASFHGSMIVNDKEDSSHLFLPKVKCELYFGHAENDVYMTAQMIAVLDQALAQWGGKYTSEMYHGAKHGWTVPGRSDHNPEKAAIAFSKLCDLFKRNIP